MALDEVPRFSKEDAQTFAREQFGVEASAHSLPSERDQNFLLHTDAGPEFVLKIANASEQREFLEAQNAVLDHLARHVPSLHCPRIQPTRTGGSIGMTQGRGGYPHLVRMLSYVPGELLVHTSPYPPELLQSLGRIFGRLDQALANFSHPALTRSLQWDLKHASHILDQHRDHIKDSNQQALLENVHRRFQKSVLPALPKLRTSVIHNDGNDYNVLVTGLQPFGGDVTGVIDFGDLIESHTVFEVAVCTAYAVLGKSDPIGAAAEVIGGYHHVHTLTELEVELLFDLMATRLATSVVLAAHQKTQNPANAYLTVSEGPAWAALERFSHINPRLAHYTFRQACGWDPCPHTTPVVNWLVTHADSIGPVVESDLRKRDCLIFDLQAGSADFIEVPDPTDISLFTETIVQRMRSAGVQIGIGRYDEARRSYTASHYRPDGTEVDHWRTIHLGIDLFLAPGTPVFAPLDGTIHSFRNNAQPQDYGPTLILRHEVDQGMEFFTLYGHLSVDSLEELVVGMPIIKGSRIGTVGETSTNGHWPPHLHFQIMTDCLEYVGDFPGVCAARDRKVWLALCPDPNLVLRIPTLSKPDLGRSPEQLLQARHRLLGPSLSVSYETPLKIVRGWMQYLYDHLGREYLDAVNNVNHIGHSHPAVLKAMQAQQAVLNTNTRYLHDTLIEYAERLTSTLPDPLRVCYFVCSGSEANELALRMARAYTHGTAMLVVDGGYHGNTTTLVDISPYKFKGPGGSGAPPHVHTLLMPDPYRGRYTDPGEAGRLYASHIPEILKHLKAQGKTLAAFLCESLLSCGGQIVLPPGYLREAYRYIREAGGVCIADEVQVGFGRVGSHFWGFQTQGVIPDIVTMGKPMGNGHPLAAVVTTPDIAQSFANGMEYFNTFGGNPVSCAVGLAVLEIIEKERLQQHAFTVGTHLKKRLCDLKTHHALIGDVRGTGLFWGIELVRDSTTLEPAGSEAMYVIERMKQLGVLLSTDGLFHNVLKIKPPMVFSKANADRLIATLDQVLREPRLRLLRHFP